MCRILLAWHFDHAHAQRPRPADRAAARDPTAAPGTAATAGPGPGRATHTTPRRRNSGGGRKPCSARSARSAKRFPPPPAVEASGGPRAGHGADRTTVDGPRDRRPPTVLLPPTVRPTRTGRRRGSGRPTQEVTVRLPHPGSRGVPGRRGCRAVTAGGSRAVRIPRAVRAPRGARPRSEPGLSDGQRWNGRSPQGARVLRHPGRPGRGAAPPRGSAGRSWDVRRHQGVRAGLHA